jgi:hypothetical protein
MMSEQLRSLVTSSSDMNLWPEWQSLSMSHTDWKSVPKADGVYIIKSTHMINRLVGESDVIKIGRGKLSNRIKAYVHQARYTYPATSNRKRGTARRIRNFWMFTNHETQFSYITVDKINDIYLKDKQKILNWAQYYLYDYNVNTPLTSFDIEKLLLVAYYQDHFENPPLHITFS